MALTSPIPEHDANDQQTDEEHDDNEQQKYEEHDAHDKQAAIVDDAKIGKKVQVKVKPISPEMFYGKPHKNACNSRKNSQKKHMWHSFQVLSVK